MRELFTPFKNILDIDGCAVPVDPDFRIMCRYGTAERRGDKKELCRCAELFFFAELPEGATPENAARAMLRFYAKGLGSDISEDMDGKKTAAKSSPPVFDFSEDEGYFLSAFRAEYGIDLLNVKELHWFEFGALFLGLPDECKLKQIIGIRSTETAGIKLPGEKRRILRLQKIFALKGNRPKHFNTLEERNAALKRELAENLEKAKREAEKNECGKH